MTDKKSDSEDIDAVIDRTLMARGAERTVRMMKVTEIQQLEQDLFDARHKAEEWEESHNIERDRGTALEIQCERLELECAKLRAAIATQAAAARTLKGSRDALAARDQRILKSLDAKDRSALLAELDSMRGERDQWNAQATDLELILAGRTTPPTEPEMVVHQATGGLWRWVSTMNGAVIHGCSDDGAYWIYGDPLDGLPKRIGSVYVTRYWALNAKRELCAWPKVTP